MFIVFPAVLFMNSYTPDSGFKSSFYNVLDKGYNSMGISQAPKFMEVSYPKESSNSSISLSAKRIFRKLLHGNAGKEHLDKIRS